MWKCYPCGTTNWEKDPKCYKCGGAKKELGEIIREATTPEQIAKIVDILEEWDSRIKDDMGSAKASLKKAKEIEERNKNISAEKKSILKEIEELKKLRQPLKNNIQTQKKEIDALKSKKDRLNNEIECDVKTKEETLLSLIEKQNEVKDKIKKIENSISQKLFSHVRGIMAVIILLSIMGLISYIIFITFDKAEDIKITISYNLGEIIAGIFAGTGIAVAGIAYAKSLFIKQSKHNNAN